MQAETGAAAAATEGCRIAVPHAGGQSAKRARAKEPTPSSAGVPAGFFDNPAAQAQAQPAAPAARRCVVRWGHVRCLHCRAVQLPGCCACETSNWVLWPGGHAGCVPVRERGEGRGAACYVRPDCCVRMRTRSICMHMCCCLLSAVAPLVPTLLPRSNVPAVPLSRRERECQ